MKRQRHYNLSMLVLNVLLSTDVVKLDTATIVKAVENAHNSSVELPEFEDCFNSKNITVGSYTFEVNPYGVFTLKDSKGKEIMSAPVMGGRCNGWQNKVKVFSLGDAVLIYMNRTGYFIYRKKGKIFYELLRMDIPISRYQTTPIFGIIQEGSKVKLIVGNIRKDRYFSGYMYIYDKSKGKINTEPIKVESSLQFPVSRQLR